MNRGFADRSLRPLGYDAKSKENLTAIKADSNDVQSPRLDARRLLTKKLLMRILFSNPEAK